MSEDTDAARLRCSSISLEDGADEAWMRGEPIGFSGRTICFPSRWQFDTGTTLALTLEIPESGERARAEGVVATCEQTGERLWMVTVLFIELDESMEKIRSSGTGEFDEIRGPLLA